MNGGKHQNLAVFTIDQRINMIDNDKFFKKLNSELYDIEQDIPTEETSTNMDLGLCSRMIKSQIPELSDDAACMAAILASMADASMGGGYVLDTDNNRTIKESYEQYKVFEALRGDL